MDTATPTGPETPGLEARVAKLEAAVEHIQRDIAEIKGELGRIEGVLGRLATTVDRMDGFLQATLPTLATKTELANLRADFTREIARLEVEIARRPTTLGVIAVVAILIAIAGLPYWGHWLADLKTMVGVHP